MKTKDSYLLEIAKLRELHTKNFTLGRWQRNETVRQRIKNTWAAYHNAPEKIEPHPKKGVQRLDFTHWLSLVEKMRRKNERFPLPMFEKKYIQGMSVLAAVDSFRFTAKGKNLALPV